MEQQAMSMRRTGPWLMEHAAELYRSISKQPKNIASIIEKMHPKKMNWRTADITDSPTCFRQDCIVGEHGWVHQASFSDTERIERSKLYESIAHAGKDVSDQYEWYKGFCYRGGGGATKDAPCAEPCIRVPVSYQGTNVQTLRLNLFNGTDPVHEGMTGDEICKALYYDFYRDVVVILSQGDAPTAIIPCEFAWLLSPQWDSYCDQAWNIVEKVLTERNVSIGNHELRGSWETFLESRNVSTLFY